MRVRIRGSHRRHQPVPGLHCSVAEPLDHRQRRVVFALLQEGIDSIEQSPGHRLSTHDHGIALPKSSELLSRPQKTIYAKHRMHGNGVSKKCVRAGKVTQEPWFRLTWQGPDEETVA